MRFVCENAVSMDVIRSHKGKSGSAAFFCLANAAKICKGEYTYKMGGKWPRNEFPYIVLVRLKSTRL